MHLVKMYLSAQNASYYSLMNRLIASLGKEWTPTIYLVTNGRESVPKLCFLIGLAAQRLSCWLARVPGEVKQEGLCENRFPFYAIWLSVTIDGSPSAQVKSRFNNLPVT